jgi:mRNA interferase YafQ
LGDNRNPNPDPESQPVVRPPPAPRISSEFKRGYKLQAKRNKDMEKLDAIMVTLSERRTLEPKHRDHALSGDWAGYRECHIEPDWPLIYRATDSELELACTGTHSDLRF